jgi:hypothetical protein
MPPLRQSLRAFGEAAINTSLADFGDSCSYKGSAGLRMTW